MDLLSHLASHLFLPRWCILDGVVVANELVDLVKWSKRGCFMFKVDFEKEYDSVSWVFFGLYDESIGF